MGAYFHHVGSTHREAKPRKTWDQMGGLLQEPSWIPVVQNSQEPRRMEMFTFLPVFNGRPYYYCYYYYYYYYSYNYYNYCYNYNNNYYYYYYYYYN
ncbi:hypothetical protein ANN_18216 [Periplaneta americana]|uniref:Uncharacterized protein n=1 Tax=Periplaneta americana TaxID=6978 RepID=A0ABQ8SQ89_PERAM|nr:hypothetical protein ANN_18216 [Periplaneta americana]